MTNGRVGREAIGMTEVAWCCVFFGAIGWGVVFCVIDIVADPFLPSDRKRIAAARARRKGTTRRSGV